MYSVIQFIYKGHREIVDCCVNASLVAKLAMVSLITDTAWFAFVSVIVSHKFRLCNAARPK